MNVSVRNTGEREGDEVVLLYVVAPPAAVALGAPRQQLAAFERLSLEAGSTLTTTLSISQRHVSLLALPTAATAGGAKTETGLSTGWRIRVNEDERSALKFAVRAR